MSQWSGLSATFKAQVKRKGYKPRIGVALNGILKYYSRGKGFTMDSKTYTDELLTAPSLSLSAKMIGGLSVVNRLDISVANQDLESDHFAEGGSYPNPENTEVKAYLVFDSGATNIADAIQFFNGIIDDFPTINYDSLKIACTSIDRTVFKKIGTIVTNADATSGFKVPEDSLGRVKPIIYGDHRFAINFTKDNSQLAADYEFARNNNVVEAVALGGGEFLIANHIINSINSNGDGIWLYDEILGRLVEVNDFTITQNTSAGCIINVTGTETVVNDNDGVVPNFQPWKLNSAGADFVNDGVEIGHTLVIETEGSNAGSYQIVLVAATQLYVTPSFPEDNVAGLYFRVDKYPNFNDWRSPIGATTSDNWVNVDRVHDLSVVLAATVSFDGLGIGEEEMLVEFDIFPYPNTSILSVKAYVKATWDDAGNLDLIVNSDTIYPFTDKTNNTQFQTHNSDVLFRYLNKMALGYINTAVPEAGTASVYEVIQKIIYVKNIPTDNMKIYFGGLGAEYGSWINSRSGHQDNNNAGDMVENAAGVVESLMRDIIGFTTINTASFNIASAGDLSASKLSFDINKITESDQLIHDILERVKSIGHFNYNDEFRMVVYDNTDDFTESGSGTPNDDDKFLNDIAESGSADLNTRQFDEHPIIKNSFWIKKNPANQIVTNFTIDYYKTFDGKFAKGLADTDTTYHAEDISQKYNHPYTKDQATVQIWLTFLIDRLNRKHWFCGWDTWYNAIAKEMWDVVNVQHPVITNLLSSVTTKKWRILKLGIHTDLGKISVEVEEQ